MPESPTACLVAQDFEPHAISLTSERGKWWLSSTLWSMTQSISLNEIWVKTLDTKAQVSCPSWEYSALSHTDVPGDVPTDPWR